MRATVKLKGLLEEKVRTLLQGQNPTPKRVAELLDELEQRRIVNGPVVVGAPKETEQVPPPPEPVPEPAGDGPIEGPPKRIAPPVPADPPSEASWREERKMMLSILTNLQQKVAELSTARTPEAREQAIAEGKLPVGLVPNPPAGFTGFGDIPVGQWMISPLGPKVHFIICGCGKCTKHRLEHWYCVVCKSGPYSYRAQYPQFTKNHMAPGGVWGISHHTCSMPCWLQYLAALGVRPGINDHEPPQVYKEGEVPARPVVAVDSD